MRQLEHCGGKLIYLSLCIQEMYSGIVTMGKKIPTSNLGADVSPVSMCSRLTM